MSDLISTLDPEFKTNTTELQPGGTYISSIETVELIKEPFDCNSVKDPGLTIRQL